MSKIRVYELAKELAVDNKVIVAAAAELGLKIKGSHSSSLQPEEADQIRRALIRKALGRDTEVVTMRVDKLTGVAEAFVERRKGNVIRRRKQEAVAGAEAGVGPSSETQPPPSEPVAEQVALEGGAAEMPGSIQAEEFPAKKAAVGIDEAQAGALEHSPVIDLLPERAAPEEDHAPSGGEPALPETGVGTAAMESVSEEAARKTVGPRVLGKIDLPQKKVVVEMTPRTEARRDGVTVPRPIEVDQEEEDEEARRGKKKVLKKKGLKREISRIDLLDYEGHEVRRLRVGGKSAKGREAQAEKKPPLEAVKTKASKRIVKMGEAITVGELAKQMSLKAGEVIAKLMELGVMATINHEIDKDIATIVAEEFEYQLESTTFDEAAILEDTSPDDPASQKPRPPVVTVMGHVDHGKTSLLDAIRKTSVAQKEHGGITQHIGAYSVQLEDGRRITFIDTPGHAAFTAMRARGARVTDIVVLVVAADDGVMPQTLEAIDHAKAAEVPLVVAVNKIDKPDANFERVKKQLAEKGVQSEDWGGDVMFFPVSALKGQGIKELLEGILLLAEVRELKANPARRARGAIIEARQDRGLGVVATVLVQNGTLHVGDVFVAGAEYGRVRSMIDHDGRRVEEAGPSVPVGITGLSGIPLAGDDFFVVENEVQAKQVSVERQQKKMAHEQRALGGGPISLEEFAKRANALSAVGLNVILKTDTHGSLEAVKQALEALSSAKVEVRLLHAAVGAVTESDVQLAAASHAIVIGFGVRGESRAMAEAEAHGVEVRFYRIIYELIDDVKLAMSGLLPPLRQEIRLGRVEVRDTFLVPKVGTVAGCYIADGLVKRGAFVRLLRDSRVIHEGKMSSLKRFKDDVREVQSGLECGIGLDNFNDVKVGDIMEVYEIKEVAQSID